MDTNTDSEKLEPLFDVRYKLTLIGDNYVGKSSLLRSVNNEVFNPIIKNTVGACDVIL